MNSRQQRAVRGAAAAAVGVTLAAVSHTIVGGPAPGPLLILGVVALAWPLTTLLVGRRVRPAALAAAVVVAQILLHAVFWATAGVPHGTGTAIHTHGVGLLPAVGETVRTSAVDPLMLAAHAVAAVATFALLHRGELLLGAVAEWFGRVLGHVIAPVPVHHPRARTHPAVVAPARRHPYLARVSRRGPPTLSGDARVA